MEQEVDIITKQVEWIKARGLGGNDQLVKMMSYIERLEEQLKPITWTTEKPTTPGWYWFKEKPTRPTIVVEVDRRRQSMEPYDGLWVWFTSGRQNRLIDISGEWSSEPIAEPQEAS